MTTISVYPTITWITWWRVLATRPDARDWTPEGATKERGQAWESPLSGGARFQGKLVVPAAATHADWTGERGRVAAGCWLGVCLLTPPHDASVGPDSCFLIQSNGCGEGGGGGVSSSGAAHNCGLVRGEGGAHLHHPHRAQANHARPGQQSEHLAGARWAARQRSRRALGGGSAEADVGRRTCCSLGRRRSGTTLSTSGSAASGRNLSRMRRTMAGEWLVLAGDGRRAFDQISTAQRRGLHSVAAHHLARCVLRRSAWPPRSCGRPPPRSAPASWGRPPRARGRAAAPCGTGTSCCTAARPRR